MTIPSNEMAPVRVGLIGECMVELQRQADGGMRQSFAVSYTHLTLPTKRIV